LHAGLADKAPRSDADIDADLKRLHGTGSSAELSRLHQDAAGRLSDPRAIRFHLTHAWVFAMEAGDSARAERLAAELRRMGGIS
jgi:hypothetical protein